MDGYRIFAYYLNRLVSCCQANTAKHAQPHATTKLNVDPDCRKKNRLSAVKDTLAQNGQVDCLMRLNRLISFSIAVLNCCVYRIVYFVIYAFDGILHHFKVSLYLG